MIENPSTRSDLDEGVPPPPLRLSAVYGILDADAGKDLSHLLEAYIGGGATTVQLRMKKRGAGEFIDVARRLRARCHEAGVTFIVNDRIDVALLADADGVHLGQTDMSIAAARALLPKGRIVGRSTHDMMQLWSAVKEGADYIGFGPIFPSKSKSNTAPLVGVKGLAEAVKACPLPLVAIGGIGIDNVRQVVSAGCKSVAVISAVATAWQPKDAVRSLFRSFK
jgi:thiamine-phosphate pyrophosphorylase